MSEFSTRGAALEDAGVIARIYNEGIEDGLATFETNARSAADVEGWIRAAFPLVVVENGHGAPVAWASAPPYRPRRPAYAGVADFSVYVAREARGRGAGRAAVEGLVAACEERGYWKLLSRIFPENVASLALCRAVGFREVGVYRRHAKLRGEWRDTVIVELLIGEARS
ncbi:MAG TPA: arsinothricin resistance N-acetyltransferase ArsN1 family A [Thermoleophilaceae bacterium]